MFDIKTYLLNSSVKDRILDSPMEDMARTLYGYITKDPDILIDEQTFSIMKKVLEDKSNCVDVGAHAGGILRKMVKFAPRGDHLAFEPLPSFYQKLVNKYKNVKVFDYALSDNTGKSTFQYIKNAPGYSGFNKRSFNASNAMVDEISVKVQTLDSLYPADKPLRFMKIDVEGAEYNVFRGAINTIKRNKPYIIFEHNIGGADFYGVKPENVYDLLTGECEMKISTLDGWLNGKKSLERYEFCSQFYDRVNIYFLAHP